MILNSTNKFTSYSFTYDNNDAIIYIPTKNSFTPDVVTWDIGRERYEYVSQELVDQLNKMINGNVSFIRLSRAVKGSPTFVKEFVHEYVHTEPHLKRVEKFEFVNRRGILIKLRIPTMNALNIDHVVWTGLSKLFYVNDADLAEWLRRLVNDPKFNARRLQEKVSGTPDLEDFVEGILASREQIIEV